MNPEYIPSITTRESLNPELSVLDDNDPLQKPVEKKPPPPKTSQKRAATKPSNHPRKAPAPRARAKKA